MAAINMALACCSTEDPVFYEDEVDIHLNLKIGAGWQLLGQKNALLRRGRMKSTILPVCCTVVRVESATWGARAKVRHYLSVC